MMSTRLGFLTVILLLFITTGLRAAVEIPQYQVYELVFAGSAVSPEDSPVRDVFLVTTWQHEQDWDPGLHDGAEWNDHAIVQNKIKYIWLAADKADLNYYKATGKPVINDELAYEGEGDG
jgi:hypothetical protein